MFLREFTNNWNDESKSNVEQASISRSVDFRQQNSGVWVSALQTPASYW